MNIFLCGLFFLFANADPNALQALERHRLLSNSVKKHLPELLHHVYGDTPMFGAHQDIDLLQQGINQVNTGNLTASEMAFLNAAILPALDSNGRVGPAVLKGHVYFAGHFSECVAIDAVVDGRERPFKGAYFRFGMDIAFRPNTMNDSCVPVPELLNFTPMYAFGLCLPASCTGKELTRIFRPDNGPPTISNPVCELLKTDETIPPKDAGFYISVTIMGVIAAVCIISGIVDYFFSDAIQRLGHDQSLSWRLFHSFSLYSNVASIFDVQSAQKPGQISPIHCIRFFSFCWVVMGHYFFNLLQIAAANFDMIEMGTSLLFEFVMSGPFAVDSFFFLSGLLLSFLWMKSFRKDPAGTNSVKGWIMFYVHRMLRLSPAYYISLLFYAFVFKQMMIGFPLNMNFLVFNIDDCPDTWYIDLLYVHNWWEPNNLCMGVSWYLASETQIFLFTPLLLLPLAIKPILGWIIGAVAITISTAVNIFLVYYYHWPAGMVYLSVPDPEMTNFQNYNELMYYNPFIRCQIYIIGMLVGWGLQSRKTLKINQLFNLAAWGLGLALMLTVTLGLYDQSNGFEIPLFWRAMYSSLSRIAWGLGLSWIIISCYYGYGGPINSFMSWHIWIPLGRLTYCGYLIHMPVTVLVLAQITDEIYFSNFLEAFTRLISIIFVVLFVSVFWSACFEISFGKMQSLLLGGDLLKDNQKKIGNRKATVEQMSNESTNL